MTLSSCNRINSSTFNTNLNNYFHYFIRINGVEYKWIVKSLKHSVNDSNEEEEGERGVHSTGMVTPEENISIKIWTLVSSSLQHYQGLSLQQQRLYCFPLSWISWQVLGQAQAVWNSSVSSSAWHRCSSSVIFLGKHYRVLGHPSVSVRAGQFCSCHM